jgi:hypothetical protein
MNVKGSEMKRSWPCFRHHVRIFLEDLRKPSVKYKVSVLDPTTFRMQIRGANYPNATFSRSIERNVTCRDKMSFILASEVDV